MLHNADRTGGSDPSCYTRVRSNLLLTEPGRWPVRCRWCRVYPRACGGASFDDLPPARDHGLSPRVRGSLDAPKVAVVGVGSIPARAGEPPTAAHCPRGAWVYPRACGGTGSLPPGGSTSTGLSPRVRGNRCCILVPRCGSRSIPARAGEPQDRHAAGGDWRVYPRACGGTSFTMEWGDSDEGLSPRVRGNLSRQTGRLRPIRSIPARAGEPW